MAPQAGVSFGSDQDIATVSSAAFIGNSLIPIEDEGHRSPHMQSYTTWSSRVANGFLRWHVGIPLTSLDSLFLNLWQLLLTRKYADRSELE